MKNILITGTKGKTTVGTILDYIIRDSGKSTVLLNSLGLYANGIIEKDNDYYMLKYNNSPNVVGYTELINTLNKDYFIGEASYSLNRIIDKTFINNNIDIGIITNIYFDHINGNDIKTQDDLLNFKLFIARNLNKKGKIVLNISNIPSNTVYKAIEYCNKIGVLPIVVSSMKYDNIKINYYIKKNNIYKDGNIIGNLKDFSITFNGLNTIMNENLLILLSVLDILGIGYNSIKRISSLNNIVKGRLNIYENTVKTVVIDFAHEEQSIKYMASFLKTFFCKKLVGIIRLSYYRDNSYIINVTKKISTFFSKLYIYDKAISNDKLRNVYLNESGKKLGEVGELMYNELEVLGNNVKYIPNEYDAIDYGIKYLGDNEVLLIIAGDNIDKSILTTQKALNII